MKRKKRQSRRRNQAVRQGNRDYKKGRLLLLQDMYHEASKSFDTAILTLAGGALGVSLIVYEKVGAPDSLYLKLVLIASWFFLLGSLVSIFVSLATSSKALWYALNEEKRCDGMECPKRKIFDFCSLCCNVAASIFLLLGVSGILIYSSAAMLKGNVKECHKITQSKNPKKSRPQRPLLQSLSQNKVLEFGRESLRTAIAKAERVIFTAPVVSHQVRPTLGPDNVWIPELYTPIRAAGPQLCDKPASSSHPAV